MNKKEYAQIILHNEVDQVLVVKYRDGVRKGKWGLPGDGVKGDDPANTVTQDVYTELNLDLERNWRFKKNPVRPVGVFDHPNFIIRFLTTNAEVSLDHFSPNDGKYQDWDWLTYSQILNADFLDKVTKDAIVLVMYELLRTTGNDI